MLYSTFEDIVLNIILIVFPILIYLVIVCYKDEITKTCDDFLLNIALTTSLYLCLRFGKAHLDNEILLFCNIPIIIAYVKKKGKTAIFLSILNIIYCYFFSYSIYLISTIKYISYFILYLCANKKRLSKGGFILSAAVIQGFFLSFEYFFKAINIEFVDFLKLLILVFTYYFVSFSTVYLFKLIEKVKSLNTSIKALEKDKEIKDALFKLTHEIKNPLAVCQGYLEMLDIKNEKKALKYISIMKQEISRSLNIMNDFLEFGKIKIVKEQIDLNLLLEDVYDCFKIILKSRNVKLNFTENEDEEIYIVGDYERLKQVLINILKNSLEASNEYGLIKLSYKLNKQNVEIIVEDNGVGMDEETLLKVKDMFYTTKKSGTGLGVALSDEIIKAHGGNLIYESILNKGTKVTIKLPI